MVNIMTLETNFVYKLETQFEDFNENLLLKPYGYQQLCAQLGDIHLSKIDLNVDTTMKSKLSWVLTSLSIEIIKPVKGNIELKGRTWHSDRKGPFFRREYVFSDKDDKVLFNAASFSVLLDMDKRNIYRKKELPFYIADPIKEYLIDARHKSKIDSDLDFTKVTERQVYNSLLDPLGHVNNCRYGEFAYDVFTDIEVDKLEELKRMDIYFKSELRKNDMFSLYKCVDDKTIVVRGENNTKGDTSFDIIFIF